MNGASRVELPAGVGASFEVFVNGVPQLRGVDFEVHGRALVFPRELAREGKLGFWRWVSMLMGVAGSYRKHETIDVVYSVDGQRVVASLTPTA